MIDQKYEMTDEVRTMNGGQAVRRIRFLRDGLWGPAGTLGGYLQSEENLSQSMDCYVSDEAVVMGDAEVSGNAVVRDQAVVRGQAMVTGWGHVVGDAVVQNMAEVGGFSWVMDQVVFEGYTFDLGEVKGDQFHDEYQVFGSPWGWEDLEEGRGNWDNGEDEVFGHFR